MPNASPDPKVLSAGIEAAFKKTPQSCQASQFVHALHLLGLMNIDTTAEGKRTLILPSPGEMEPILRATDALSCLLLHHPKHSGAITRADLHFLLFEDMSFLSWIGNEMVDAVSTLEPNMNYSFAEVFSSKSPLRLMDWSEAFSRKFFTPKRWPVKTQFPPKSAKTSSEESRLPYTLPEIDEELEIALHDDIDPYVGDCPPKGEIHWGPHDVKEVQGKTLAILAALIPDDLVFEVCIYSSISPEEKGRVNIFTQRGSTCSEETDLEEIITRVVNPSQYSGYSYYLNGRGRERLSGYSKTAGVVWEGFVSISQFSAHERMEALLRLPGLLQESGLDPEDAERLISRVTKKER